MSDDITIHTAPLKDRRIDFDVDSRSIIVDDSRLTAGEIESVAQIASLAASAMIPGFSMTPKQAKMIVKIVVKIAEMARDE